MKGINKSNWDESYERAENHIFYPKEEVVKFLNRFVRKKKLKNNFKNILYNDERAIRGLDFGCGIGHTTKLMNDFNIQSYGVDISDVAIKTSKSLYPYLEENFQVIDGISIPFKDFYFDISICESVIDSMHFELAVKMIKELERVTKKLVSISFISGDDHQHYREFNGEKIIKELHEKNTIQSWYNWSKIKKLISRTSFNIIWAHLITDESMIDRYKYGRYYLVLSK